MDWYISPTGSPSGNGTIDSPWDLKTALDHPPAVQPGDTIWLRGGTYGYDYGGSWLLESYLSGTVDAPITVRQYPGESATVQLYWEWRVIGQYTYF